MSCGLLQPSLDMRPPFAIDDSAHGGRSHSESFRKYRLFGSRSVEATNSAHRLVREFRLAVQLSSYVVDRGVHRAQHARGMLAVLLRSHPLQVTHIVVARISVVVVAFVLWWAGTDERFQDEMVHVTFDHRPRGSITELHSAVAVIARSSRENVEVSVSYSPVVADFVSTFVSHNRSPLFFRHRLSLAGVF